jgi:CDP-diacylglycerol pyrophosphatase
MLRRFKRFIVPIALLAFIGAVGMTLIGDSGVLWKIVNDQCMLHWTSVQDPSPCVSIDLSHGEQRGVAILKDRVGIAQLLAIPTARISGIESLELQRPDAPDLFGAAWRAREFMWERLSKPLPRGGVGLAINSAIVRSQDQAHIHVDCLRPDVYSLLSRRFGEFKQSWSNQPYVLLGAPYDVLQVPGRDLTGINPFDLVAQHFKSKGVEMWRGTIVVVGSGADDIDPGFILLAGYVDRPYAVTGHGEDLLDHSCRLADMEAKQETTSRLEGNVLPLSGAPSEAFSSN